MSTVNGVHHVTAITRDAQINYDFYTKVLGLRFVKKTVNFDDPYTYHLYYGDSTGSPGTAMTFFVWKDLPQGTQGKGIVSSVHFAVPVDSIGFWKKHLNSLEVSFEEEAYFTHESLVLEDPDGLKIRLVASEKSTSRSWEGSAVSQGAQIQHIHGVELTIESSLEEMRELLKFLGYTQEKLQGSSYHLVNPQADFASAVDVRVCPSCKPGQVALGSTHHVAFRVKDGGAQGEVRRELVERGYHPTPVIERFYFRSVYSRVPEGILFEIATDEPGFLVDEAEDELGSSLRLPPHYEEYRSSIEPHLAPFSTNNDGK